MIPLCLVMPAYNEEGCIGDVIRSWLGVFDSLGLAGAKMVVVNDGSRDKTGEILDSLKAGEERLVVIHQQNGGHGAALRHAYDAAVKLDPEWVFQTDSDDQFEAADLKLLWDRRSESKFILGRRLERKDARHRLVITRILKALNVLLFGRYIPDVNVPFRLIKGEYLKSLLEKVPPGVFAPNIFLAVLASRDGQSLMNIPVTHKDRRTGTVSIVKWRLIKACLRCVRELAEFRLASRTA